MKINFIQLASVLLIGTMGVNFANAAADGKGYKVDFTQSRGNEMKLTFNLDQIHISEVTIEGNKYSKLDFGGWTWSDQKGYASLPIINSSVALPADKNVTLSVEPGSYTDYNLSAPILPSKGKLLRNQDPAKVPYIVDPASVTDKWYPGDLATSTDPFIMRDIRGTSVYVNPVQYNAAKKILRVYNSVVVKLAENNTPAINPLLNAKKYIDPEMHDTYKTLFANYNDNTRSNWKQEVADYLSDILVLYTSRDAAAIKPYIDWKKQMGYKVTAQEVAVGTNVKSNISSAYAANKNIGYVLLVGDWADIKSDVGTSENAPMDPMMGCVVGNDNYPDIYIGRFSANSATDVTTQVNKAIKYEKEPQVGATWYKGALGIGSDQGNGQGDDGEMDKNHIENIWVGRLSKTTYTTQYKAYDPGASASSVSSAINSGVSVINYCGHGANNQFVTSGFSSSNVSSLSNGDKLPIVFSVACVNGQFHTTTCFAEYWLRKVGGGAVATIMSTINQDWVEPMIGQDYMNDLLTGGYSYGKNTSNPGSGTNTDHGKTRFGSITFNAEALMLTEKSSSLSTLQTWTIFGDPALQVRTDSPKSLVISNCNVPAGSFSTNISVGGQAFPSAMVSIWDGTNQPFSALTDASGNVTISHTLAAGTKAKLTVTGFNLVPYIADVTIGLTSINNIDISNAIRIYPNPSTNGKFYMDYSLVNDQNSTIKVLDVVGNVVYSDILEPNTQRKSISLNNMQNGIYFIQFESKQGVATKKLMLQQ